MSKPLNKQELTKWKNKFKLYKVLHNIPDITKDFVYYEGDNRYWSGDVKVECPFCQKSGKKDYCPTITLGIDKNGIIKEYNYKTQKEGLLCIEWIKYV